MSVFAQRYGLKPPHPVINQDHPIARGLVFDAPFFERGGTVANDIAGKLKGAISASGATWEVNPYGAGLLFSAVASNVVYTVPVGGRLESMAKMSYEAIFNYTGLGAGSLGRLFVKGSTNSYFQVFANSSTTLSINAARATTTGAWTFPLVQNQLYHFVVTYDSGNVANNPVVYLNGVPVTVTTGTAPVGAQAADDVTFNIGNRADGTRNWAGEVVYTRAWNRILNAQEVKVLAVNPWCIYKQPALF